MIKKLLAGLFMSVILVSSFTGCKKTTTNTNETSEIEVLDKETTIYEDATTSTIEKETTSEIETTPEEETMPSDELESESSTEQTQSPTEEPTIEPTKAPTTAPTIKPTQAPTVAPTIAPTKPVVKPTQAPTTKPTVAPTQVPTAKPTEAPTKAPEVNVPVVVEPGGVGKFPVVEIITPTNPSGSYMNTEIKVKLITKNIPYGYQLTSKDFEVELYTVDEYSNISFVRILNHDEYGVTGPTYGLCNNEDGVTYALIGYNGQEDKGDYGECQILYVIHGTGNKALDENSKNNKVYENVQIYRGYATDIYKYGDWYYGIYSRGDGSPSGLCIVGYTGPDKDKLTVPSEILGQKVKYFTGSLYTYNKDENRYNIDLSLIDWDIMKKNDEGLVDVILPEGVIWL